MNIRKCDICQKEIYNDKRVVAAVGFIFSPDIEMCFECGEPILKFLRKQKVIDKNNNKIKKS